MGALYYWTPGFIVEYEIRDSYIQREYTFQFINRRN